MKKSLARRASSSTSARTRLLDDFAALEHLRRGSKKRANLALRHSTLSPSSMASHLGLLDSVLLVASMAVSAFIGLYFSNKNRTINAYMLGDQKLSLVPVAISLMTSCTSALTLLGNSTELYYEGPSYGFLFVAILLSGPITAYTVLPVFYRLNELSLYQYLRRRYGLLIKYLVTVVFAVQMVFYNAIVLYLPAVALHSLLNVSKFYSILMIGLMCVVYSAFGGLKAVVWTDFFQAFLMYASILAVAVIGTLEAGGIGQVFELAREGGRLDLGNFFQFDLTTRHTFFGVVVGATIKHVYLVGVNQVQMQRAMSLPSLRLGQYSFTLCSLFMALMNLIATYLGFVLYSAYRSCDPYLAHEIQRRDAILVHYIANRLSSVPGLRGLFVAGIFSATLSTLSSFANSMAALALEDFIRPVTRRLSRKELSERSATILAKVLATIFGLTCVLMAFVMDKANSRMLQATTTLFGALGVPFLAAFFLGIYTRFTNTTGLVCAFLVTLSLGSYITVYQTFYGASLSPSLPVYYDQRCALVFNMTMSSESLPPLDNVFEYLQKLPQVKQVFHIESISYMTLPVVQFALTIIIAAAVSFLTGGWNQVVDERCLSDLLRPSDDDKVIQDSQSDRDQSRLKNNLAACCDLNSEEQGAAAKTLDSVAYRKRKMGVGGNDLFTDGPTISSECRY